VPIGAPLQSLGALQTAGLEHGLSLFLVQQTELVPVQSENGPPGILEFGLVQTLEHRPPTLTQVTLKPPAQHAFPPAQSKVPTTVPLHLF